MTESHVRYPRSPPAWSGSQPECEKGTPIAPAGSEERFWLTGEGDSFFFKEFADVLGFLADPGSCEPRESLLP